MYKLHIWKSEACNEVVYLPSCDKREIQIGSFTESFRKTNTRMHYVGKHEVHWSHRIQMTRSENNEKKTVDHNGNNTWLDDQDSTMKRKYLHCSNGFPWSWKMSHKKVLLTIIDPPGEFFSGSKESLARLNTKWIIFLYCLKKGIKEDPAFICNAQNICDAVI